MNFDDLLGKATDKSSFETIQGYIDFAGSFIEFTKDNLQARIISRNEPHYQFFQYGSYASYQVTRPINLCVAQTNFKNNAAFSQMFWARSLSESHRSKRVGRQSTGWSIRYNKRSALHSMDCQRVAAIALAN
ncbi:MAG: hypothetical protein ACKO4U_12630 [Caldilinea sp.]|jgi:hypothetical protein